MRSFVSRRAMPRLTLCTPSKLDLWRCGPATRNTGVHDAHVRRGLRGHVGREMRRARAKRASALVLLTRFHGSVACRTALAFLSSGVNSGRSNLDYCWSPSVATINLPSGPWNRHEPRTLPSLIAPSRLGRTPRRQSGELGKSPPERAGRSRSSDKRSRHRGNVWTRARGLGGRWWIRRVLRDGASEIRIVLLPQDLMIEGLAARQTRCWTSGGVRDAAGVDSTPTPTRTRAMDAPVSGTSCNAHKLIKTACPLAR